MPHNTAHGERNAQYVQEWRKSMKKRKTGKVLLAATVLCTLMLAGCGDSSQTKADSTASESTTEQAQNQDATFTVTFYDTDGTTVLSTEEVASGSLVTEYTPEKDNQIFMGWFGTPTLAHEFDFTQPITADTDVFAGFMENVEDTRAYAIVGNGKSALLAASSWGSVINEEHYLTKSADANEYSITLDLCEGDEFQFALDSSWTNQKGGGYLATTDQDETSYFSVSGGLSDTNLKSNIKCLVSGNYTLTLTTYPGADVYESDSFSSNPFDTITFLYNGEMKEAAADFAVTYYIKGAVVTGWEDKYDEAYMFKEDNGVHTLTIDLEEGDEFLLTTLLTDASGNTSVGSEYVRYTNITDEASLGCVDGTESANILAKTTGTYTLTYNPETAELTVSVK